MAHLLMIESWVLSSGILLPQIICRLGHSYTLLCRDPQRYDNFLNGNPHPVAAMAEGVVVAETNDFDQLLLKAKTLHAQKSFSGVITCCDYYLVTAAKIAEKLGLPTASSASLNVANNKAMMREAMARAGLPGPTFAYVNRLEDATRAAADIGYPLIIKPADLCGSLLVKCVQNSGELKEAFQEIQNCSLNPRRQPREPSVLLEEYLEGDEFSVESYSYQGVAGFWGITDKSVSGAPFFIESGHMFPANIDLEQETAILECTRDALIAVGYDHGLAHTEVKLTPKGPRIVEINTRAGGNWISELIRHVHGINPLEFAVRLALGEAIPKHLSANGQAQSAAIQFLIPEREGTLKTVHGWQTVQSHHDVVDSLLHPHVNGKVVTLARDNDAYLAYVMCRDLHGFNARTMSANILANIYLEYENALKTSQHLTLAQEQN